MTGRTLGFANSGPRVGPLVISEVQYNSEETIDLDELEFVEIFNPSSVVVNLANWRIRGGIDFEFPETAELAPQGVLVIVPFDVTDLEKLGVFHARYGIDATVEIVGGYTGVLDNGGETIRLERPDEPPQLEPDFIPHLLEDGVVYEDDPPWPAGADGNGQSLHRGRIDYWGHDVASWTAATPTPGTVDLYVHPGDANFDDVTDVRDFNIWNAHKFTSGTHWSTGDFNWDGVTDVRDFNIWNAHKFTSAPAAAPVDAVLEEASVSDPTSWDAGFVELAWLHEFEQSSTLRRASDDNDPADAALDKLLASYWP
jgi:hypothetical protein